MKNFILLLFLAATHWIAAQNFMHIGLTVAEVSPTQKIYNVYVKNYDRVLASQYSLAFDPQKMTFVGVRNSIPDGLGNSCFGNPYPGSATHAWIQTDLDPDSYIDSSVIYQLVFDIIQPGGSTLCFTNVPLDYEFVKPEEELITPFYIHDDCYTGDILIDPTTGLHQPENNSVSLVENVILSSSGELNFTSLQHQQLTFTLTDILGREILSSSETNYSKGHSNISLGQSLSNAIYMVKVVNQAGQQQSIKVFAK